MNEKKKFIAFFDLLGFKQFIENNDEKEQQRVIDNILRDIEQSLVKQKDGSLMNKKVNGSSIVADLEYIKINTLSFSDTIVFWTNDNSLDSLEKLLIASKEFNFRMNKFNFPIRGALVYGNIYKLFGQHESKEGFHYGVNSVFGEGIVKAYEKAESQEWAGTVIDQSIIDFITEDNIHILENYAKKYKVPYKTSSQRKEEELVLNLIDTNDKINRSNIKFIENYIEGIKKNFARYNKPTDSNSIQNKITNTINFINSYKNNIPSL
ncbi:hypothetical protein JSO59_010980 [Riemerella anatipestifer]|uniref:hypothetical protein n=1 Tax=Riemerella anatipestifer TaxID=34085 RepID=UPI0030C03265